MLLLTIALPGIYSRNENELETAAATGQTTPLLFNPTVTHPYSWMELIPMAVIPHEREQKLACVLKAYLMYRLADGLLKTVTSLAEGPSIMSSAHLLVMNLASSIQPNQRFKKFSPQVIVERMRV